MEIHMKVVAFERSLQGTGASRRLRRTGKTPGIVYGASGTPELIELDHNALYHALRKEAFHASILDLEIAGSSQQVLLRDVQYHPFKQLILHVDFLRVDAKVEITVKVPLHFLNQESNPAVKTGGAVLTHVITDLEVTCLPGKLPEFIELDLATIEVNQSVHAKDVTLPEGVALVQHLELENPVVVSASIPAAVISAEDEAEAAKPAEGQAPAA
jgi:large subunit ribosomal protein L25